MGNANSALVTLMMARNEIAKGDGGRDSVGVADLLTALETNVRLMNFRHVCRQWSRHSAVIQAVVAVEVKLHFSLAIAM